MSKSDGNRGEVNENSAWKTAITQIGPNEINVRGYAIEDLMGRVSFAAAVYLILRGELPSESVARLLDAILVTSIDHGATPPSTLAAITSASTGAPLNAALAAGILSINKHHGGAIESCMEVLQSAKAGADESGSIDQAAEGLVQQYADNKKRIPGFGHRLHTEDPRTARLLELAGETEFGGDYLRLATAIEAQLGQRSGRRLPMNVDGAIAAVLCEMGFAPALANSFFIIARVPGLVAHIVEEQERHKPVRRIHPTNHTYDGPEKRAIKEPGT